MLNEHYGDVDRFILLLEQLRVCREFLLSRSVPKARMALILLDNLADILLYRRSQNLFRASDQAWFRDQMPRYPRQTRKLARQHFEHRVELGRDTNYDRFVGTGDDPLVGDFDATVLSVAHSYRNAAYHRDTHNPFVIDTLARTLFATITGMFTRFQPGGSGTSVSRFQQQRLAEYGVTADRMLYFREAAEAAIIPLREGLEFDERALAAQLSEEPRGAGSSGRGNGRLPAVGVSRP